MFMNILFSVDGVFRVWDGGRFLAGEGEARAGRLADGGGARAGRRAEGAAGSIWAPCCAPLRRLGPRSPITPVRAGAGGGGLQI